MHDDAVRVRAIVPTALSVVLLAAACAGSDDASDVDGTLPEITLTPTSPPPTTSGSVDGEFTETPDDDQSDTTTVETTGTAEATVPSTETPVETPAPTQPPAETTTAPETTAAPTTTTPPAPFDLQTDGLGSASFGADPDGVIDFLNSFLGGPASDTGWVDPFEIGPCGGTQLRQVRWGVLTLEFSDVSVVTEGRPHFYAYYYGIDGQPIGEPVGIETPEGITLGSTVAELIAAYPDVTLRSADEFIAPNFFVNDNLRGLMTGLADDDTVTQIIGGLPCDG